MSIKDIRLKWLTLDKMVNIEINKINDEIERNGKGFFNIQVIGSPDDEHHSLTIFCEDVEFSYIEHDNNLFNVVPEYVIGKRASGKNIPFILQI